MLLDNSPVAAAKSCAVTSETVAARPIIKWAGGKTKLLSELLTRVPSDFGRYYEPFCGGAALFFEMSTRLKWLSAWSSRPVIGDANHHLIGMYKALVTDVEAVIASLEVHKTNHRADWYANVRDAFNAGMIGGEANKAAAFVYLNRTCFTPGSQVLMEDESLVDIENIRVGDRLWGGRTVSETLSSSYDGEIVRVNAQGYPNSMSVTVDHPVLSCRRIGRGRMSTPEYIPAGKLKLGDFLLMPTLGTLTRDVDWRSFWPTKSPDISANRPRGSVSRNAKNLSLDLSGNADEDLGRFLGYYLADGFGDRNRISFTFPTSAVKSTTNKSECIKEVIDIAKRRFGVDGHVYDVDGHKVNLVFASSYVYEFVSALIPGQTHSVDPEFRHTKRLDISLMIAPTRVQHAIMSAWLKADGGIRRGKGSCELSGQTAIPGLAAQMYRMAQRVGMKPSWRFYYPAGLRFSLVSFSSSDIERLGFDVPAGRREGNGGRRPIVDGMIASPINSVTKLEYSGRVHNLEVDGDHHLCVDGFVSHNCFNGLWRVNGSGEFNVPMGDQTADTILRADELRAASRALTAVDLRCGDYRETCADAQPGDFVYFDPPYDTEDGFTAFTSSGFGRAEQDGLAKYAVALRSRGVHVMLSNSATTLVRRLYRGWKIERVHRPGTMSSDPKGRGKVREVIITPK